MEVEVLDHGWTAVWKLIVEIAKVYWDLALALPIAASLCCNSAWLNSTKAVENMRRIPHRCVDEFGKEGGVLVGNVSIERRIVAVFEIHLSSGFARPPAR